MNFINTGILSLILILFSNGELQQRPMLFIHGFGDSCKNVEEKYKFDDFVCIESGAGIYSLRYLTTQINKACKNINAFIESQKPSKDINEIGFYLLGFSQGGLIARGVFHKCTKLRPLIKGIFTIGTPNLGIDKIPLDMIDRGKSSYLQRIFNYFVKKYFKRVSKDKWIPAKKGPFEYVNHFKSVPDTSGDAIKIAEFDANTPTYKKYVNFNEAVKDPQNADHVLIKTQSAYVRKLNEGIKEDYYDNLDLMINFTFLEDNMIDPIPSQTFGAIFNEDENKIQDFSKTQAYENNFMGLRSLYDKSKLINCAIEGDHFAFDANDYGNLIRILSVEECNQMNGDVLLSTDYNKCLEYMLKEEDWFLKDCKCDVPKKYIHKIYDLKTNPAPQNKSPNLNNTARKTLSSNDGGRNKIVI